MSKSNTDEKIQQLSQFFLYEGLSTLQLELLKEAHSEMSFESGEVLIRQNQLTKEIYFVLKGTAKVSILQPSIQQSIDIAMVSEGSCLGHYMLSKQVGRTANVCAQTRMAVLVADANELLSLFEAHVDIGMICYRNISHMMLDDIMRRNLLLEKLHEYNRKYYQPIR